MKNEVEGSFIPVKNYEFVLPKDFKIEETQQFATTLPTKKSEKTKEKNEKKNKSIECNPEKVSENNIQEEEEEEKSEGEEINIAEAIFGKAVKENPQESIITKSIPSNVKNNSKELTKEPKKIRPYSAVLNKRPDYLKSDNIGKTKNEMTLEETQKQGAKDFVTN